MIGPVVRRLRQERNLSQEELANAARVSSGYLSKLERGLYRQPSGEVLARIAHALGIAPSDLYRAAGMDYLLIESDPAFEILLKTLMAKLEDLPDRDRQIIAAELRRILLEEKEANGEHPQR
jgi:transcriptional regulator with XRE-family HTH domain